MCEPSSKTKSGDEGSRRGQGGSDFSHRARFGSNASTKAAQQKRRPEHCFLTVSFLRQRQLHPQHMLRVALELQNGTKPKMPKDECQMMGECRRRAPGFSQHSWLCRWHDEGEQLSSEGENGEIDGTRDVATASALATDALANGKTTRNRQSLDFISRTGPPLLHRRGVLKKLVNTPEATAPLRSLSFTAIESPEQLSRIQPLP